MTSGSHLSHELRRELRFGRRVAAGRKIVCLSTGLCLRRFLEFRIAGPDAVISGLERRRKRCPLHLDERTWPSANVRSEKCHKQISRSNSNTSSARAIELGGTSRPTGLAAFKLIASSNLVGRTTGRFGGSSTERIRSAYFPICRYASIRMGKRIGEATGGLDRCELRDRDLPQVISSTLKASI